MPSVRHEASTYSLYEQPEIALGLLAATGVTLPEHDLVHVDSPKLPDLVPTDFEADAVFTVLRSGTPVLSLILEIQLRWDDDKIWVWPAYLANLRERRRCPVHLLVICLGPRTARRCAQPIDLGHPGTGPTSTTQRDTTKGWSTVRPKGGSTARPEGGSKVWLELCWNFSTHTAYGSPNGADARSSSAATRTSY
jgi:hypothetical protein